MRRMSRQLAISDCDRFSEKSASSSEKMPSRSSVSTSEMSGSSSSCDIHYRPLPPIRKKRIRSLLVQKMKNRKFLKSKIKWIGFDSTESSVRVFDECVFVRLINTTSKDPPFIVHVDRKYKIIYEIENHCLRWLVRREWWRFLLLSFAQTSNQLTLCQKKNCFYKHITREWNETRTNKKKCTKTNWMNFVVLNLLILIPLLAVPSQ